MCCHTSSCSNTQTLATFIVSIDDGTQISLCSVSPFSFSFPSLLLSRRPKTLRIGIVISHSMLSFFLSCPPVTYQLCSSCSVHALKPEATRVVKIIYKKKSKIKYQYLGMNSAIFRLALSLWLLENKKDG